MSEHNPELHLAEEFVRHTGCNIFLTGKAGTGKTTFLHTIARQGEKRLIVTAPTGVAAINAGGVTLHSFFQMPFSPFVPGGDLYAEQKQHRMSREKKNIIRSLDLLVIDEISMVRADLLDCVDHMLRRHRRSDKPFGGVQLLLIGDLHQLPPVVTEQDWQLLRNHYESPYFFSSNALQQGELIPIELKHIYRQSDRSFIDILNEVRSGKVAPATLEKLNSRLIPDFAEDEEDGYITLCTHNSTASRINTKRLTDLPGRNRRFMADLDGEFPEHAFPTIDTLDLKEGAQVMFVRNDPSPDKEYFNGKIGTIASIGDGEIEISCKDESNLISVGKATWENTKYSLDAETGEITSEVLGTFTQYPLKLAWAITIHKSQGLTFDKAVIDAEAAFAHGQVYVALSRCRTFEGLVLRSPISSKGLRRDPVVSSFSSYAAENQPGPEKLEAAKIIFQQQLLMEAFTFSNLRAALSNLVFLLERNITTIHVTGVGDLNEILQRSVEEIVTVGENFKRQLAGLFKDDVLPGSDAAIRERLSKAAGYFTEKLKELPEKVVLGLHTETDNKELKKRIKRARQWLEEATAVKLAAVSGCGEEFSPPAYLRAISHATIERPKPKAGKEPAPEYHESDIAHPELFERLKQWRTKRAQEERLAAFHVMHQRTLIRIAIRMPDTMKDLGKVKGIGKKLLEKYGEELVELISTYRKENNITEVVLPEKDDTQEKKEPESSDPGKGRTKDYSLELLQGGMSIKEIAEKRSLTTATVEGHLAHWVKEGVLSLEGLVEQEKIGAIRKAFKDEPDSTFKQLKEKLGGKVSYGEIKLVHASLLPGDDNS